MTFTWRDKYELAGRALANQTGTVLDLGARDRVLAKFLPPTMTYRSADVVAGHDYQWNLEKPLPCPNDAFDFVVALDVLEHLEHIHHGLRELIRVAQKKIFVTLPNMSCLPFRLNFLRTGFLSQKYALLPAHQGDRHRWLTIYPEIVRLVNAIAEQECGCRCVQTNLLFASRFWEKVAYRLPLPATLRAYTLFFEIDKPEHASRSG